MKLISQTTRLCALTLAVLGLCSGTPLLAQETEEKVIPTEVSEPPYSVGDLVVKQGYYIEQGNDQPRINFRLENNQIRIYWIDADGLIAEAGAVGGSINFEGPSVRGNPFHRLQPLPEKSGLAGQRPVFPPHTFFVRLVLEQSGAAQPAAYSFRYNPALDQATEPTAAAK